MEVTKVDIDTLKLDPKNVRKHSNINLIAIEKSLSKFGQVEPLVVQKSSQTVIGGNGRLEVMRKLGYKTVATVQVDLDREQAMALAIALNRSAELAEWDVEGLTEQLAGLDEELSNIAYADFEIDDFEFKDPGEKDNDSKPESHKLTVEFSSYDEQQNLFNELTDRGFKVK